MRQHQVIQVKQSYQQNKIRHHHFLVATLFFFIKDKSNVSRQEIKMITKQDLL